MKILYITNTLDESNGWARYSLSLIKEVSKTQEVFVISNSDLNLEGVKKLVKLHSPLSSANPFKNYLASRHLQKVIDEFKPEVIHFIVEPYVVLLPFLKVSKYIKKILTIHGTYSFLPNLFSKERVKLFIISRLIKRAYNQIDGIISVSNYTKDLMLKNYNSFYKETFDEGKVKVITNGIDLSQFSEIEIGNKQRQIVFVGAVKQRKGIIESLIALDSYKNKFGGDFKYVIVGSYDKEDKYFRKINEKIKEFNLLDDVEFTGFVSDEKLKEIYSKSSLFLMLPIGQSLVEGFGLVYLEAGAYGIPTIGSRDSGASDAIVDGITGYLVDPKDTSLVAEKIHLVLDSESIKSLDCVEWVKKQDIKDKVKLVLDYYKNV